MTPRAGLLPNESPCPDCNDGRVPVVRPGRDEMLYTGYREVCPRCDGTSVILSERRDKLTRPGEDIALEFTILRNDLAREHAIVVQQADHIDKLLAENRRFREAIDKAARVIERRTHAHA